MLCPADFSVKVEQSDGFQKGRVEIYNNGRWGLVCSNGWDTRDATVVCQETNLGTNGTATQLMYNRTETLWLSGVKCVGNEPQLSFCPHNGIGVVENCTFVSGIECFGKRDIKILSLYGNYITTYIAT